MNFIKFLLVNFVLLAIFSASVYGQANKFQTVATVNDIRVTVGELEDWVELAKLNGGKDSAELRQAILNDLIVNEAIKQDARKSGLLARDKNTIRIQLAEKNAYFDIWFKDYISKNPVTDTDVRAEYERLLLISKDPKNNKEYLISQIVLDTEESANLIISRLNKSESFEKLAQENSVDKGVGQNGGSLGWVLPSQLISPINEVVVHLSKGVVTNKPIRSSVGWHIMKIENTRPYVAPTFEQVKPSLLQSLTQKKRQEAISNLMKNVKVVKR